MSNVVWTPEMDAKIERLWNDGKTASEVAAALGGGKSRNAVISRLHRLGVPKRAAKHKRASSVPTSVSRIATALRRAMPESGPRLPRVVAPRKPIAHAEPLVTSLLDLKEGCCKFPLGEGPDWAFCGRPAEGAYCQAHRMICYEERKK